jgi:integrase
MFKRQTKSEYVPWNKGRIIGQKPPLKPKHVWAIRTRLQMDRKWRDLAMFNLAIDSKLRGCDLVRLRVEDIAPYGISTNRATVRQRKTGRPVTFEISEHTRSAVDRYLTENRFASCDYLFPGRGIKERPISTRQYARRVSDWVECIGLDPNRYGTHSLRRTKAALIYRKTGNLRAVQLLLGHSKIESTVKYLGIEVDDAIELAERVDI